jgi:outer membrane protein TolC
MASAMTPYFRRILFSAVALSPIVLVIVYSPKPKVELQVELTSAKDENASKAQIIGQFAKAEASVFPQDRPREIHLSAQLATEHLRPVGSGLEADSLSTSAASQTVPATMVEQYPSTKYPGSYPNDLSVDPISLRADTIKNPYVKDSPTANPTGAANDAETVSSDRVDFEPPDFKRATPLIKSEPIKLAPKSVDQSAIQVAKRETRLTFPLTPSTRKIDLPGSNPLRPATGETQQIVHQQPVEQQPVTPGPDQITFAQLASEPQVTSDFRPTIPEALVASINRRAALEASERDNSIRESISPEPYRDSKPVEAVEKAPTVEAAPARDEIAPERDLDHVWWSEEARQSMRPGAIPLPMDLDSLLVRALMHSAQIHVFSELPLIRDTAITEASANFDWRSFLDTMWNDTSDPVGSILTTGSATRFQDHRLAFSSGLRRRNEHGGQIEFAQELGHQNNNSDFFIPNNQATSRLRLSYTHPLLRGSGQVYNQSLIVLAEVDANVARDEMLRQVQGHLLEVTRAYWGLALERDVYLQKVRLLTQSQEVLDNLVARQGIDTYRSQIVRAQSAVSIREAALIRAEVAVRNAEARIRALVNDPEFASESLVEIIPTDKLFTHECQADLTETLRVAMQKRPEIAQAIKQIKAASVRNEMTKNELLPTLNLVLNSYVSGLQGQSDIGQAWADQFSVGQPSYAAGFQFDVPVANRAARARYQRSKLEMRQFESQLRLSMETVNLEVGVAVRETDASYREMQAKYRAMAAASEDNQYVRQRWELLPGDNPTASLVFDDMLRTQQRLADTESEFAQAITTYNLSLTNLKRAAGVLLEAENITTSQMVVDGTPTLSFEKLDDSSGFPTENGTWLQESDPLPSLQP